MYTETFLARNWCRDVLFEFILYAPHLARQSNGFIVVLQLNKEPHIHVETIYEVL